VHDYDYTFTNSRRRSNSNNHGLAEFKTKFEAVEQEPVFEEELHGGPNGAAVEQVDGEELKLTSSVDTSSSTEEETEIKKA
jgi:hypothetical protein